MTVFFIFQLSGVDLSTFTVAMIAVCLIATAFIVEIVRSGLDSVHGNQWDAAAAMNMSYLQALRLVVVPHAWKVILPPAFSFLGVEMFGGLIMKPPAGGVTLEAVEAALGYGYGPGTASRFISLPTHHTSPIAIIERRSKTYVESCWAIPEKGELPDPLPAILARIVDADVVLNTCHISGPEAVRLVEVARRRGMTRLLVPVSRYQVDEVSELTRLRAFVKFSFYFVSHATQAGLTPVEAETHTMPPVLLPVMVELIRTAMPARTVVNSDAGVFLLPPVEALREFLLLLKSTGLSAEDLRIMSSINPSELFGLAPSARNTCSLSSLGEMLCRRQKNAADLDDGLRPLRQSTSSSGAHDFM